MKTRIEWIVDGDTPMPELPLGRLADWIETVASRHDRLVGPLNYIFCGDEKIIEVNRQFLSHDYYTDIITFDYTSGRRIAGDMFISLDTVASNAEQLGVSYDQELKRVIIHGVLHLCGINDKGPGERAIMEAAEDEALAILNNEVV